MIANLSMKLISLIILFLFIPASIYGSEGGFTPWDFDRGKGVGHVSKLVALPHHQTDSFGLQSIFQAVSAVDGNRCPMSPTCSAYGLQALEKHGLFIGSIMTVDRLMREMDERDLVPLIQADREYHYDDPVGANDFWWFSEDRLDK